MRLGRGAARAWAALMRVPLGGRPLGGWGALPGYNALHGYLHAHGLPAGPEAFAQGPLRRFLELAAADGLGPGERVRVLEHARHWIDRMEKAADAPPGRAAELRRLVGLELDALARDRGELGAWIGKVVRGGHTHHAPPPFP